jgi:hypothetical protein
MCPPPWPEVTLPFRSREAAITGAAAGVDNTAICALSPFTFE